MQIQWHLSGTESEMALLMMPFLLPRPRFSSTDDGIPTWRIAKRLPLGRQLRLPMASIL